MINIADLAKVSEPLQKKFDSLLQWMKEKGWTEYFAGVAALNLDKPQDEMLNELVRKLDKLPLKNNGFNGFAGIRAICGRE